MPCIKLSFLWPFPVLTTEKYSGFLLHVFLSFNIVDVASNPDLNTSESKGVPLLLILGYGNGVQVWNIAVRISQFGYGVYLIWRMLWLKQSTRSSNHPILNISSFNHSLRHWSSPFIIIWKSLLSGKRIKSLLLATRAVKIMFHQNKMFSLDSFQLGESAAISDGIIFRTASKNV